MTLNDPRACQTAPPATRMSRFWAICSAFFHAKRLGRVLAYGRGSMNCWNRTPVAVAVLALATGGCAAGSSSNSPSTSFDNGGVNGPGGGSGGGIATVAPGDAAGALPPETKVESNYQSPVATGRIVWTANPVSGRVAYVDATSFNVQTVQAGNGPTYLAAVPSSDPAIERAIVINTRSHDATLLTHNPPNGGPPLVSTSFASTEDANSWAVSQSGTWAIAWTDFTRLANVVATQGFQDIAVLNLSANKSTVLSVGYRPSQIAFSQNETRAFVVTQDGISVIDLQGGPQPLLTQNFALSAPEADDASAPEASPMDASASEASAVDASSDAAAQEASFAEAAARDAFTDAGADGPTSDSMSGGGGTPTSGMPDVSFTPDGSYALVRQDGVAAITVVSLKDGTPTRVPLSTPPTALTVAPDGTFAVAVLRDSATVALLPLPGIASDPTSLTTTTIAGETIGRAVVAENLTTKQTSVLLFTTAAPIDQMTVMTLQPATSLRTIKLYSPVLAVFPTADGQNAIVLHNVTPTVGSSVKGAFSIVPIAQNLPAKIVSLTAPPTAVALAPTSDRALVTFRDDSTAIYGVDLAKMPSLEVLPYVLASPPTAAGIAAAAGTGFIAQNYTDGRITFIDLDAGAARTITGFELGAGVVQGSPGGDQ